MKSPLSRACLAVLALLATGGGALPPPLVSSIPLPGGVAALLQAAHVPAAPDPAVAMMALVRAVHATRTSSAGAVARYLESLSLRTPATPADMIPLPLGPELWSASVLKRRVTRTDLAAAIFADRSAALVYHGLMMLDDETLAWLGAHPAVVSAIASRSAGAFAEWGRSIHVANGRVQLPGGPEAAPLWAKVVGRPPADTERFIRALLERDAGRAACFYDAVMHLDPERRAFALGAALPSADRPGRFEALYATFVRTATIDSAGAWPLVRHPVGPRAVLSRVMVVEGGRMAAPSSRAFWEAALGADPSKCASLPPAGAEVDAAWLAEQVDRGFLERRAERLSAIAFAQRVYGRAGQPAAPAVCEVVASFPRYQALLLALERMGLDDPADHVSAIRFAERLWAGADRGVAVVQTAQAQGVLAVLDHAASARAIDQPATRRLARSLWALGDTPGRATAAPAGDRRALPTGAIGAWMRETLLPGLCRGDEWPDACLVRTASGAGSAGSARGPVAWEGERYAVDLGAAAAARIDRIREGQNATSIGDALSLGRAARELSNPGANTEQVQRAAAVTAALARSRSLDRADLFGHAIQDQRAILASAATRLSSSPPVAGRAELSSPLSDAADLLLADALVSFAYALAIGDPDSGVLMSGDPSRLHRFDARLGPALEPWQLPEEVQTTERSRLMEGSVLGLETAFSRTWLQRLSIQDPGRYPRPDPQDVDAFGESAALFNAFRLTDEARDAIVGAIRRGRMRLPGLLANPEALWRAASRAGISEWRCRAISWAGPDRALEFVSLSELMWLGEPNLPAGALDPWGVAARPGGGLTTEMPGGLAWEDFQGPRGVGLLPARMADVHLRVAEMLSELELPAALAPGIASYVVWDVMTTAEMAHPDDWLALVRAVRLLPEDRTFDYVSTLTATGPLVPVGQASPPSSGTGVSPVRLPRGASSRPDPR